MSAAIGHRPIGHLRWAIAEGYIPPGGNTDSRALASHEAICVLNAGDAPAQLRITVFFTDADPAGPYLFEVAARRSLHLRMNELDAARLPAGREYSALIESDVPVVVQHTRLDSRAEALALLSTVAFAAD